MYLKFNRLREKVRERKRERGDSREVLPKDDVRSYYYVYETQNKNSKPCSKRKKTEKIKTKQKKSGKKQTCESVCVRSRAHEHASSVRAGREGRIFRIDHIR